MDQGSKKAVTPVIDPQVGSDAALLQASLSVFQHLEYAELAQTLLDRCSDWIGARGGVCLSVGEDGRRLAPVASTFAEADPRYRAFMMLEASLAQAAFAEGTGVPPDLRDVRPPPPLPVRAHKAAATAPL